MCFFRGGEESLYLFSAIAIGIRRHKKKPVIRALELGLFVQYGLQGRNRIRIDVHGLFDGVVFLQQVDDYFAVTVWIQRHNVGKVRFFNGLEFIQSITDEKGILFRGLNHAKSIHIFLRQYLEQAAHLPGSRERAGEHHEAQKGNRNDYLRVHAV